MPDATCSVIGTDNQTETFPRHIQSFALLISTPVRNYIGGAIYSTHSGVGVSVGVCVCVGVGEILKLLVKV